MTDPASSQSLAPFSCRFTPAVAELMATLDCSLALSTYQAGKVILLSPKPDGSGFFQFPRTFPNPMGLAAGDNLLGIATKHGVDILENSPPLAPRYSRRPDTYDSLFIPRAHFTTGMLDIHDLAFTDDGIIAVNTLFSCLCKIDGTHSFTPIWQPSFIQDLIPGDCCHLNGLALDARNRPAIVSALGNASQPQGWRNTLPEGGVLIDISSNETLAGKLSMPHSPRLVDDALWCLLSGNGALVRVDQASGNIETVTRLPGFARGLARCGDYFFAGISRLRPNHKFGHLPIAKLPPFCGVVVIHLPTGAITGTLEYLNSCKEIYDVQVLTGLGRPAILQRDDPFCTESLTLPGRTFLSAGSTPFE